MKIFITITLIALSILSAKTIIVCTPGEGCETVIVFGDD
jgi:hypothetical protein